MNEVIRLCMLICFLIIVSYFIDEVASVNDSFECHPSLRPGEKFTSDLATKRRAQRR